MVFCLENHGVEPAWASCVRSGTYPSRLVPDVSELSQFTACLLLGERGHRVPHPGGVEWPSDGSGKEHPEVEVPTYVLDLRLSDLILKAESDQSSGGFSSIHNGGRSVPTAGVLGASCCRRVQVVLSPSPQRWPECYLPEGAGCVERSLLPAHRPVASPGRCWEVYWALFRTLHCRASLR